MTDDELLTEPRTVKPRSRTYRRLPVVAVYGNLWVDEDGQVGRRDHLVWGLREQPPTLFATIGSADFLAYLDQYWSEHDPDHWQFRVTEQERAINIPGKHRAAARVSTTVHYFGFKGGKYHKVIDPVVMYGHDLDTIWPYTDNMLQPGSQYPPYPAVRLLQWAKAIRDFCDDNRMEVRATIGSMSSQFLTDHRFYPQARRKVPAAINARARENLPGNYYALSVAPSPRHEFTAWYLDQRRAHHYHARTNVLPDANSLYAMGYFLNLSKVAFPAVLDDPEFYGLYCLRLKCPKRDRMLHWLNPRHKHHFVFSNELPLLLDMGYKVKGVIAAWGSNHRDMGLARYATWADQQLDNYNDAPWLKPLLLATYGSLATRASWGETVFRLASSGIQVELLTGRRKLRGTMVRAPQRLEPKVANVIHRGMIEAGCRTDSIGLAHWLQSSGYRILSIYADAVMVQVDDDRPLPSLPEPWRLKTTLNHLQFVSKQAFMSGEMTKLPGVSAELKRYARHSNGQAPQRKFYDALTGLPHTTGRKI